MSRYSTVSYARIRSDGTWGLRGPADALRPGTAVRVEKRNGQRKTEVVGAIVWTGVRDGVDVAIARIRGAAPAPASRGSRRRDGGKRSSRARRVPSTTAPGIALSPAGPPVPAWEPPTPATLDLAALEPDDGTWDNPLCVSCIGSHADLGGVAPAVVLAPQTRMGGAGWALVPICPLHLDGWWEGSDVPPAKRPPFKRFPTPEPEPVPVPEPKRRRRPRILP